MDDRLFNVYLFGFGLGAVIGIMAMSLIFIFNLASGVGERFAVLLIPLFIGAVFGWQLLERLIK